MGKKGKAEKAKPLSPRVEQAVASLKAIRADDRAQAAAALGSMARGSDLYRQDIVQAGALAPVVSMLSNGLPHEKEAAAACLRGLSTNPSVYTLRGVQPFAAYDNPTAIVQADAIAPLVALLQAPGASDVLKEYAAATLNNISTKAAFRTAIASAGALKPLLELVREGPEPVAVAAAYALGSLVFQHEPNRKAIVDADGHKLLRAMAEGGDETVRRVAEYSLEALTAPLRAKEPAGPA